MSMFHRNASIKMKTSRSRNGSFLFEVGIAVRASSNGLKKIVVTPK
jgi:hypothetical protein